MPKTLMKYIAPVALALGLTALMSAPNAMGDTIGSTADPPIWVYTPGCGTGLYSGETNGICTGTSLEIQNHSNTDLSSDLLVILGIPGTGSGDLAPVLTYNATNYSPGAAAIWGWNGSSSEKCFGTSAGCTSSGDVYALLGLASGSGGADSESFTNWQTWDLKVDGINVTDFGIFVYELPIGLPGGPSGGTPITVGFSPRTPFGSFVVGASCTYYSTSQCTPSGNVGSTPFTQAGLDNVPEPETNALMGIGLLGLVCLLVLKRNRTRSNSQA